MTITGPDMIRSASREQVRIALQDPSLQIGLAGPPGIAKTWECFEAPVLRVEKGKTKLVRPKRVEKLQFHSEYSPAEAMGMYVPAGDSFRWESGPVDLCYSEGGRIILDEINEASGPMKTYLYGLLDRGPGGTISYVGRTFVQQPGYQVVATQNGYPDQGDLPAALLDRFDAWFLLFEPSEEQYQLLEPDVQSLCRLAYEGASDPMEGPEVTFRMLFSFQKLRKVVPYEDALLGATYGNKQLAYNIHELLRMETEDQVSSSVASKGAEDIDYCEDCDSPTSECICGDE